MPPTGTDDFERSRRGTQDGAAGDPPDPFVPPVTPEGTTPDGTTPVEGEPNAIRPLEELDRHVTVYGDIGYTSFLVPGLMMMSVLQNAFANSSSSLIQSKITGNIIFVLLPPLSYREFFAAYVIASVLRGLVVGLGVWLGGPLPSRPLRERCCLYSPAVSVKPGRLL